VLDRRGDDVRFAPTHGGRRPAYRQVVRFGGTGGEDDFVGVRTDERRNALARVVDGLPGTLSIDMSGAARVAELVAEPGSIASRTSGKAGVVAL